MIYIPVKALPSGFKPYPFKSFRMKSLTIDQALRIGTAPTDKDIRELIKELTDEIDVDLLVPIDLRFLVVLLAFNIEKDRTWQVTATCPYCGDKRTMGFTRKDFPAISVFTEDMPYPLTVSDDTHIYELGFATIESMAWRYERDPEGKDVLSFLAQYVMKIDNVTDFDEIRKLLGEITDFPLVGLLTRTVEKYLAIKDTYKECKCLNCEKTYRIPLSALEVTQYTPFLDTENPGKYKTNFGI